MTRDEFLRRFVYVRRCVGCGELLAFKDSGSAFCSECRQGFGAAMTVSCPDCLSSAVECTCMPKLLSASGALCLRKLFFYDGEKAREPQMKLIYCMKRKNSRRLYDFAAGELRFSISEELDTLGASDKMTEVAVTNVPRGKRSRALHGFDQAELLARALSRTLDVRYVRAFRTRIGGGEQKKLDKRRRLLNARKSIIFCDGADVKGSYVVLVDDIVTTGASMSVCVDALMKKGASGVLCLSLASENKK